MIKFIIFIFLPFIIVSKEIVNEYNGLTKKIIKGSSIIKLDKSMNEEEIIKGTNDSQFIEYKLKDIYLNAKNHDKEGVYYLKIIIKNNTDRNLLSLYGIFRNSSSISCHYLDKCKVVKLDFKRNIVGNLNLLFNYCEIPIKSGEIKKIYIKLNKIANPFRTSIYISELDKIIMRESNYSKSTAFLVGLTLVLSTLSLFTYIKLRKNYLIYYSLICLSTYFKSFMFMQYLRDIGFNYTDQLYFICYFIYIFSLIEFIKGTLKLEGEYKRFRIHLNGIFYLEISMIILLAVKMGEVRTILLIRAVIEVFLQLIVLYISFLKYKEGIILYLYSFLPGVIYPVTQLLYESNVLLFTRNVRIAEQIELLGNIVLIGGILFYEIKELLRTKTKLEESETVIATINSSGNLMHAMHNMVDLYKTDIKHSKMMFFHKTIVHDGEKLFDELYYSFSIPSINDETEEYVKHEQLEKFLYQDQFKTHYIVNDIENSDLYSKLLKGYKSMIILRLSALNELDLGYLIILNENKKEYLYNDIMKDFRYKVTLLVQHFSLKEDRRRKSESSVITQASIQNWLLVLEEAIANTKNAKHNIELLKKLAVKSFGNDKQLNKATEKTIKDLEYRINSIDNSLDFKKNNKIYNTKSSFTYKWIKERIRYLRDSINKLSNCKLNVINGVKDKQEFYCQMKMLESILIYCLRYLYNKVKESNNKIRITLSSKIENYKLVIAASVEGLDLDEETPIKGYRDEVQLGLLYELEGKKDLQVKDGKVLIQYNLNILKLEDRKDKHLHYRNYIDELSDIDLLDDRYLDPEDERDRGVDAMFKILESTTIDDDMYK